MHDIEEKRGKFAIISCHSSAVENATDLLNECQCCTAYYLLPALIACAGKMSRKIAMDSRANQKAGCSSMTSAASNSDPSLLGIAGSHRLQRAVHSSTISADLEIQNSGMCTRALSHGRDKSEASVNRGFDAFDFVVDK